MTAKIKRTQNELDEVEASIDQHYEHKMKSDPNKNKQHDRLQELLTHHNETIQESAKLVYQQCLEQGFDPVAEMGPATGLAWLMYHGNRYANMAPHSEHGLTTMNPVSKEEEVPAGDADNMALATSFYTGQLANKFHNGPLDAVNMSQTDFLMSIGLVDDQMVDENRSEFVDLGTEEQMKAGRALYHKLKQKGGQHYVLPVKELLNSDLDMFQVPSDGKRLEYFLEHDLDYYMENGVKKTKKKSHPDTVGHHQVMEEVGLRGDQGMLSEDHPRHKFHTSKRALYSKLKSLNRMLRSRSAKEHGLDIFEHNPRAKFGQRITDKTAGRKKRKGMQAQNDAHAALDLLGSYLIVDADHQHAKRDTRKEVIHRLERKPVGNAGTPNTSGVMSLYDSDGFRYHWGHQHNVTLGAHINEEGKLQVYRYRQPKRIPLLTPLMENVHAIIPQHANYFGEHREGVSEEELPHALRATRTGERHNDEVRSVYNKMDGPSLLASLTNPDYIRQDMPEGAPSLQAMHRIFELDDLEHLRGFTGDWIVSEFPEGPRFFVTKKGDDIESKENHRRDGRRSDRYSGYWRGCQPVLGADAHTHCSITCH